MALPKKAVAVKHVHIKQEWCKGCGICAAFCPRGALSMDSGGKAVLETAQCTGCGFCEMFCPDFALVVL